jgi:hypothetical protein
MIRKPWSSVECAQPTCSNAPSSTLRLPVVSQGPGDRPARVLKPKRPQLICVHALVATRSSLVKRFCLDRAISAFFVQAVQSAGPAPRAFSGRAPNAGRSSRSPSPPAYGSVPKVGTDGVTTAARARRLSGGGPDERERQKQRVPRNRASRKGAGPDCPAADRLVNPVSSTSCLHLTSRPRRAEASAPSLDPWLPLCSCSSVTCRSTTLLVF